MSRLCLVVRDLYPTRLSQAARAGLPRLKCLEQWLRRGDRQTHSGGWRGWLQREYLGGGGYPRADTYSSADASAGAQGTAVPFASIAAAALPGVPSDQPLWLASPVHWVAGLDTLRLHPAGLLTLSNEEQQLLSIDFESVFSGSGWKLISTGRRELLLAGGPAGLERLATHDPAQWLGTDPAAGLPKGAGSEALRRVGTEIEMWLHDHPVNRARLARRQLNANGFWLWGGGGWVAATPRRAGAERSWLAPNGGVGASLDDLFVDGLTRLVGSALSAGPPGDRCVVCDLGTAPDAPALLALDQAHFAVALGQWDRGVYTRATLLAGDQAITLDRDSWRGRGRQWWRTMRPVRPWWETLLEC